MLCAVALGLLLRPSTVDTAAPPCTGYQGHRHSLPLFFLPPARRRGCHQRWPLTRLLSLLIITCALASVRLSGCLVVWLSGCSLSLFPLPSNHRHTIEGAGAGGDGSGGGSGEGGSAVVISQDVLTGPVHVAITVLAGKNTYSTQVRFAAARPLLACPLPARLPLGCAWQVLRMCLSACTSSRLRCRTRIEEPARACFPSACTRMCPCCCGRGTGTNIFFHSCEHFCRVVNTPTHLNPRPSRAQPISTSMHGSHHSLTTPTVCCSLVLSVCRQRECGSTPSHGLGSGPERRSWSERLVAGRSRLQCGQP
jgi:hypothetical protein